MENQEETTQLSMLENLLRQENYEQLTEMLQEIPTVEVADFLSNKDEESIKKYLTLLPWEDAGRILSDLPMEVLIKLFRAYHPNVFAKLFKEMSSDIRADLYRELTDEEQTNFNPYLAKTVRDDVITLAAYPPDVAGGIMTTDFVTIDIEMNAEQALRELRLNPPNSNQMIYYLYVVNNSMKMMGILSLKDLIFAKPETAVKELLAEFFIYAETMEDRESVANKVERYDLVAIPVLNNFQQIVGIVRHDDAMDILQAEQTEDMEKFSAIMSGGEDLTYSEMSIWRHFQKRVVWLVSLAAVGILSGMIIHHYQNILESLIMLAIYMPMMAATGGNTGTQSATVVLRALALGELTETKWWQVLMKEFSISVLLAISVALMTFIKIYFYTDTQDMPGTLTLASIGLMVSFAITIQVVSSTLFGAILPIVVKRMGGDPAVAAGPMISTIVDITGLLIYFTTAKLYMGL